ncbi:RHS repeat-associated core domain-containing protein [Archangium lansingense]|uniref:RHS repeat-associated core domain-containing protein n=1 Tax=Archangium lansingense TaxID=2995310 RepID=UPI003B7BBA6A
MPEANLPDEETTVTPIGDGKQLVHKLDWTYAYSTTGGIYQRYPSRIQETSSERQADGQEVELSSRENLQQLDPYGNRKKTTERVFHADVIEETNVDITPSFEPVKWVRQGSWPMSKTWERCSRGSAAACSGSGAVTQKLKLEFDGLGLIGAVEVEPDHANDAITVDTSELYLKTSFTRDEMGLVKRVVRQGAAGSAPREEEVGYRAPEHLFVEQVSDAMGHTTRYAFHPGLGVLARVRDPHGAETTFQYDGFGRPRKVLPANGATTTVTYGWQGLLPYAHASAAGGNESLTQFDALGRTVREQVLGFDGTPVFVDTEYDVFDQVLRRSLPRKSSEEPVFDISSYDNLGRLDFQSRSGEDPVDYIHEAVAYGTKTTVVDADGRASTRQYDQLGRLVLSTDASNTTAPVTTQYLYGQFGNLEKVIDSTGSVIETQYDLLGRVARTSDPNAGIHVNAYNAFGEKKWEADNDAGALQRVATTYVLDKLGRITSASNSEATTAFVWEQDPLVNGYGKLKSATRTPADSSRAAVVTDYEYDDIGRPLAASWQIGVGTEKYRMGQSYDAYGRLQTLTYPTTQSGAGLAVEYAYTARGDVSSVIDSSTRHVYWSALDRGSSGQLVRERFGNGVEREKRYDRQGRLRFLEAKQGSSALQRLSYEYSAASNPKARHDLLLNASEEFLYDALDRLERWTVYQNCSKSELQYVYDATGNLKARNVLMGSGTSASYTHDSTLTSQPHAVTRATFGSTSLQYEYDYRGRQWKTRDAQSQTVLRTIEYTPFDLPTRILDASAVGGSSETMFDYDADGSRVRKLHVAGTVDEVIYAGGLYQKRKQGAYATHLFQVPTPEGIAAEVRWEEEFGVVTARGARYFLSDGHGTPETVTNEAGSVIERLKYDPFGERRNSSNLTQAYSGVYEGGRIGFTGHEEDDELGLINMRGRIYDPRLGRFLTTDPVIADLGSSQALNAYSYVVNNPLKYTDPSGFVPYMFLSRQVIGEGGPVSFSASVDLGILPPVHTDDPLSMAWNMPMGPTFSVDDASHTTARHSEDHGSSMGSTASKGASAAAESFIGAGASNSESGLDKALASAKGLAHGFGLGVGISYGIGALSGVVGALTFPALGVAAGVTVGLGLLAYGTYQLVNGGAEALWESATRIGQGQGSADDFYAVSAAAGGLLSGRVAKPALLKGYAHGGQVTNTVTSSIKSALGAQSVMDSLQPMRGTQVGLRNPKLVDELKAHMENGTYEFESPRGRIGGTYDPQDGIFYIGEGHHRMAAAIELAEKNPAHVQKLLQNGRFSQGAAPTRSRPLPSRNWWLNLRNRYGF